MIRAVVSDFGGVLTTPLWEAFAAVQEDLGIPPDALGAAMGDVGRTWGREPLTELECGRVSEADFFAALEQALRVSLGRDEVGLHRFSELYWAALGLNEPVAALLASCRDAGYRMALLTNNVREWEPRWRSMLPVDELFEVVVDSAFVGIRKPDPAIYELTAERLGVPLGECLFLDDFEVNCATATELGMTAVRYEAPEQAVADVRAALAADGAFALP